MDISTALLIVGILAALALSLWRLYLKVSADGVITLSEVVDALDDASEAIEEAKDEIEEVKSKK